MPGASRERGPRARICLPWWGRSLTIRARSGIALNHSPDSENFFLKLSNNFRPFQSYFGPESLDVKNKAGLGPNVCRDSGQGYLPTQPLGTEGNCSVCYTCAASVETHFPKLPVCTTNVS